MTPLPLGTHVTFDWADVLTRRQTVGRHGGRWDKTWAPNTYATRGHITEGIIIGIRTLADGYNDWEPEGPIEFYPLEYKQAYLVAWHLRRRPVYVLPQALELAPTPYPHRSAT